MLNSGKPLTLDRVMTSDDKEVQRGRFLTTDQRAYLIPEHDYTPPNSNAESQVRSKIRRRTKGAIHDLALVARNMSQKDRSLLLNMETPRKPNDVDEMPKLEGKPLAIPEDDESPVALWGWVGFSHELESIIQFYYRTLREIDSEEVNFARSNIINSLEFTLEEAERLYQGFSSDDRHNVEASIDIETTKEVDIEKAKRRLNRGQEMRPIELKALVESGEADIELKED